MRRPVDRDSTSFKLGYRAGVILAPVLVVTIALLSLGALIGAGALVAWTFRALTGTL